MPTLDPRFKNRTKNKEIRRKFRCLLILCEHFKGFYEGRGKPFRFPEATRAEFYKHIPEEVNQVSLGLLGYGA